MKRMGRLMGVPGVALVMTLVPSFGLNAQIGESERRELDALLDAAVAHEDFSGVTMVADREGILFEAARGWADRALEVPQALDGRFLLASVSKSFTAAAVLRLVDGGKIDVHASALEYLPESELDPRITIHHLLTHSSGLVRDLLPGTDRTRAERFSTEERVQIAVAHGLRFDPGTRFAYSSPGYVVLGAIIEAVLDMPLPEALDSLVFRPLGMSNTGLERGTEVLPKRVERYERLVDEVFEAVHEDPTFAYGSGSVSGTALDLIRFGRALLDPGFLSEASLAAMRRDHISGQGYGVRPYTYRQGPRLGEGSGLGLGYDGGTAGAGAIFNVLVDHGAVAVVLTNTTPFAITRLSNPLLNTVVGYEVPDGVAWKDTEEFYEQMKTSTVDEILAWAGANSSPEDRSKTPTTSELFQVGWGLFRRGRLDEAHKVLTLRNRLSSHAPSWVLIGRIHLATGNRSQACEAFSAALEANPDAIGSIPIECPSS